ncbi:hypothetical protein [Reichenbachiella sp.]|uniref:hypothetical protein n=1 Tax=Reichenbachiella sp. TaxID=2184521 RepID=UPI003BB1A893
MISILEKKVRNFGLLSLAVLFTIACHQQNKNKVSPAELMKSREIRKVSEAEILKKGGEIGHEILELVQAISATNLMKDSALCEISEWRDLDSLESAYQVEIQKVNVEFPTNSELDLQLLSAYQYNLENNLDPTPSVQKLDAQSVLYAYPIDASSNIYKYCLDSVQRKQAEMWSIKIPIKEIINRL